MPAPLLPLFRLPEPKLRHLVIQKKPQRLPYKGSGRGKVVLREVERKKHAALLGRQLREVQEAFGVAEKAVADKKLPAIEGLVLKIVTESGYKLEAEQIHALTSRTGKRSGPVITLLNALQLIDDEGLPQTRITLHVPFGALRHLEEKVKKFREKSGKKGFAYLANISSISQAALDALWTDTAPLPQDEDFHWWELWVRRHPETVWTHFAEAASALDIQLRGQPLRLPEHVVVIAGATYRTLTNSIPLLDTLAEVRGAHPCSVGFTDLDAAEQNDWVREALTRIRVPANGSPAVCVLDTGVNRGHPLLANLLAAEDCHSVFADGDASDGYGGHGHGTPMAGLAAYGDLRELLLSTNQWDQKHRLESVRLLNFQLPHHPDNYGSVTQQAIFLPEMDAPERKRVFSLAVTAPGPDDGRPTAWSAAVDSAAFGESPDGKRLILVSAGNVDPTEIGVSYAYPDDNRNSPIENPAQAWNAVTVGAITHRTRIEEGDDESRRMVAIAGAHGLSPFSRTGCEWDDHWPLKPEITMEGGNAARHAVTGPDLRASLEPISTSAQGLMGKTLCAFNATSAATALASRVAAQIGADYPQLWPETIRGLLVHSARWTEPMLGNLNPHRAYKAAQRVKLTEMLRTYGFGEPDVTRSRFSADHAATLIREDQLQPYSGDPGDARLHDCHIHSLPWPAEILQEHFDSTCTMRVTLSYFTAPNPSANNALGGSRYRYGGSLLRFLVRNKGETDTNFRKRLEKAAREENDLSPREKIKTDSGWALGTKLRGKSGSLVQDVWQGTAADLALMNLIAVFPVKGWWASRKFPAGDQWENCHRLPMRYSLVVSIESDRDIPIYTQIQNLLSVTVEGA